MSETATPHAQQTDLDIARVAARAYERDRYLSALLAPGPVRNDLIALAAFAGEIARVPAMVSEPMIGEIRFQWWRDALDNTDPLSKTGHPIADLARETIARHDLPHGLFMGYVDAHAGHLYDTPLPDEAALRAYMARTEGALFELTLRILGRRDTLAREIAAAAGLSYGLVRSLIELPALWAQGRILIPDTQLARVGLSMNQLRSQGSTLEFLDVVRELTSEARAALASTRRMARSLSRSQRVAVLPVALVEPYLRVLEKAGRDPLRNVAELTPLERIWPLFRSYWSGRL